MIALHVHASLPALAVVEWSLLALTVLAAACYLRGLRRVRRHSQGRRLHRWRPWALMAAVVTVVVVAATPLGELLEERLSTHMVQHVVLIMVAAPLLAFGAPGQPMLAGLPTPLRGGLVRLAHRLSLRQLTAAPLAWLAATATMWIWHLPGPYDLAVTNELVHLAEHATFLLTAWWFWWHLLTPSHRRLQGLAAACYVAAAVPPGAALGAVLTFPQHPLYPAQAANAAASGINPLLDQRVGGLVMWIPLDFVYLLIAIGLFARWLHQLGARWPEPEYLGREYAGRLWEQTDLEEMR